MEVVTISDYGKSYRIHNPVEGRIGSKINMGVPYEHKLLHDVFLSNFKGTAFDIGAHIGNHSLYFAAICKLKVIAWEPYEQSRKNLEANIALNPTLDIKVIPWAAGDRETFGRFTKGMWLEFDPSRDGDKLKVDRGDIPIYPIDKWIEVPDVSVVKVDVEGMESQVLKGMLHHLKNYSPVVYAETHTDKMREQIREVLGPLGYRDVLDIQMGSLMTKWAR